jgi:hypothetical protein
MASVDLFKPSDLLQPGDQGFPDFGRYKYKFLAQGDSWFSIGAIPPTATTNLLLELDLQAKACAVNCAHPGFELRRMIDSVRDPKFTQLLVGTQSWRWDGILMSAGGNDLIDAIQVLPRYGKNHPDEGQLIPPALRILLRPDEWKSGTTADRYISDSGWETFSGHLVDLFAELQQLRDSSHSQSVGAPLFVHCYDYLLARDAPAGFGIGPWLFPAVRAYGIPQEDWEALGVTLIERFKALLQAINMSNLHVVFTTPGTLTPAAPGSTGPSNDWQNEIHPTAGGYRKLASKYGGFVDQVLP